MNCLHLPLAALPAACLILTGPSLNASFDPDNDPALERRYPLDATLADATGNNPALPTSSFLRFEADRFGSPERSLDVEELGALVVVTQPPLPFEPGDPFAFTAWVRLSANPADSGDPALLIVGPANLSRTSGGRLLPKLRSTTGTGEGTPFAFPENLWAWIALVSDGETVRFYLNARQAASMAVPEAGLAHFAEEAGKGVAYLFFDDSADARFDELRLYERSLSPTELEILYRRERFGVPVQTGVERALAMIIDSEPGKAYQPQWAFLPSGPWTDLGRPFNGTGEAIAVFDRLDADRRFYRALEGPADYGPDQATQAD